MLKSLFLELIEKQNRRTFDFNIIKSFQLDTIYKDQYGDGHETFRAIRHSIIGISVDFALVFDDINLLFFLNFFTIGLMFFTSFKTGIITRILLGINLLIHSKHIS